MKLIVLKENINKGLNIVGRVTGKNLTLPILSNILISTQKNILNLSGTDLEIGIKYWVLCKTEKEGKITIPARTISNFINLLPEEKITLETKNQDLIINCKNNNTKIKGLDAEEFPIIPKTENKDFIELNSQFFCQGLSQVVDFCAINQARPELSGVYFSFQKDKLKITATDSFRLAEKVLKFEQKTNKEFSFILPQKTAREVVNIFSENEGKIKLYYSSNQVLFESPIKESSYPQVQLVSRLIEGEYPDYQGIIPDKHDVQVILNREDFLNQVKTASIFSGKSNEVKIKTNPEKGGIEILSQNPELGENKNFLSGQINGGDKKELETSFNYKFLLEGLSNIKSPKIVFELNKEEGPAVVKPEGDPNYLYILMPIKS